MTAPSASEVSAAITLAHSIPGLYRKGESAFLYKLARRRGHLVEIGCWQGRTTSLLVQAARAHRAHVTTIDPFSPMPAQHKQSSPELWRSNLKKLRLNAPRLLHMTSREAATQWPSNDAINFLFIDGAHDMGTVFHDLAMFTPLIPLGGVVALHDTFYPTIPGVIEAITDWWASQRNQWAFVGLTDYTSAFRRIE